jgi:fructose-1,6-bisphosphatase/inositol monophosphatase family enzyme
MNGAMVHGIRSTGASTAALVSVAAGGIDVYWCVIPLGGGVNTYTH